MVTINTRDQNKLYTREKILSETMILIQQNGFVKVSTKDIAVASGVSQGSIFLHFGTKNQLIEEILISNLNVFQNDLVQGCRTNYPTDQFSREFISVVILHENFLSRAYKDYPYLPEHLQKYIDDIETLIKNLFFDNLKQHRSMPLNIIDSFLFIDAFYAQIKSYLLEKNAQSIGSFLKQRRGRIMKLYSKLFEGTS